jgi:hypothetical protein
MASNKALILPVHTLPANRAPEAHRRLAAGGLLGRIVLDFTVEAQ